MQQKMSLLSDLNAILLLPSRSIKLLDFPGNLNCSRKTMRSRKNMCSYWWYFHQFFSTCSTNGLLYFVGSLRWSQESYVYWLMLGKIEKLILVILSVEAFIVVSAACLSGNIYRWNTPVLSSSICTAVAPCWDTYMWTVRWCCKSLRIRLSNFSTLQMTWNMAWAIFSTGDK